MHELSRWRIGNPAIHFLNIKIMFTRTLRLVAGLFVLCTLPIWFVASVIGWLFTDYFFLSAWSNWIVLGKNNFN